MGGPVEFDRIDLRNADLRNAQLLGLSLREAILVGANLRGADARGADLSEADLTDANASNADFENASLSSALLTGADFSYADLTHAILNNCHAQGATFYNADLEWAEMNEADLSSASLVHAKLIRSTLCGAKLTNAKMTHVEMLECNAQGADFTGAQFFNAVIARADLRDTKLIGCSVYGVSAWEVRLDGATQSELNIQRLDKPIITVDRLDLAQFINLLISNTNLRAIIDTVTSKVVLILGRFSPERLAVLRHLRDELGKAGYAPVLFDFDKPASRDITETVSTLAHLARFVVVDLTEARSVPQELSQIVPFLPSVPVQPILQDGDTEYGMFEHFTRFPWVLPTVRYRDLNDVTLHLLERIVEPVEEVLRRQKTR